MDANGIVNKARRIVARHRLAEGQYCRWLWQNEKGRRELGVNEYGCADAANILYTIGDFVREPEKRAAWVRTIQGQQDPGTGMFTEATHHTIHTTAHCLAALELFDALPLYLVKGLQKYMEKDAMAQMLWALDWDHEPWSQSHQGAGLYAALSNAGMMTVEFRKNYFAWLREHADPITGLGLAGRRGDAPLCHQLYGWFHYFFNHEHAHMPIPNPEKIIDSCIDMYENGGLTEKFCREVGFMEIDWIFAMNRASRQTPHRFHEVKALLKDCAEKFLPYLDSLEEEKDDGLNDLHMLFGVMCAVAELQIALPGLIETDVPLKNVLDRRPFI